MLPSVLGQLRDRGDLIVPVHHDTDAVALADGRAAQQAGIADRQDPGLSLPGLEPDRSLGRVDAANGTAGKRGRGVAEEDHAADDAEEQHDHHENLDWLHRDTSGLMATSVRQDNTPPRNRSPRLPSIALGHAMNVAFMLLCTASPLPAVMRKRNPSGYREVGRAGSDREAHARVTGRSAGRSRSDRKQPSIAEMKMTTDCLEVDNLSRSLEERGHRSVGKITRCELVPFMPLT